MQSTLRLALVCFTLAAVPLMASASTTHPMPPVPNGQAAPAAPANADHFSFITGGDNRSTGYGYPMPACFKEICTEIGLLKPPFVVWTGDCIQGYGDSVADANAEYDVLLSDFSLTNSAVYNAPGNHEFSLDINLLPVYLKRMAPLYGSFDYGNSHFVLINTNAVAPDNTIHDGSLDDAQYAWLESDLKANTGAKNIFVFMHHYPFGPADPDDTGKGDTGWVSKEARDTFHSMMVKYGVRAVFAGHNHIYYHTVKDGIDYYISGGAGAPLDASPDKGGFLHYLVVNVDGDKASVTILQPYHLEAIFPKGNTPDMSRGFALVTNTEGAPLTTNLLFHVSPPAAGMLYSSSASVSYKDKHKPTPSAITSVVATKTGGFDISVSVTCPTARTTEVLLAQTPMK